MSAASAASATPKVKSAAKSEPKSPVKIGDEVFVFSDHDYKVVKAKVSSNPGDHIWVEGALGKGSHFVGPHRWDKTAKGAKQKAIVQLDRELSDLFGRTETLQKLKTAMQKKASA